jgi:late competence protein required for DNA uptake (superfamily II DNA/RNA helicase)
MHPHLRARLSALTRAQVAAVNGRTFPPCRRCGELAQADGGAMPNGWAYCRPCYAQNGADWRKAVDDGQASPVITVAQWRKE